jgi:hypothetical protein
LLAVVDGDRVSTVVGILENGTRRHVICGVRRDPYIDEMWNCIGEQKPLPLPVVDPCRIVIFEIVTAPGEIRTKNPLADRRCINVKSRPAPSSAIVS